MLEILAEAMDPSAHHSNLVLVLGIIGFMIGGELKYDIFRPRRSRNTFANQEINDWLVALDIMEPIIARVTPQMPLSEAFEQAKRYDLEYLPVAPSEEDTTLVGLLDCPAVRRAFSAEVLSRQERADNIHAAQTA